MKKQKGAFDIRQVSQKRDQQKLYAEALSKRDNRFQEMKSLVYEKRDQIMYLDDEIEASQKALCFTVYSETKLKKLLDEQKEKAALWKERYEKLSSDIAETACEADELRDQLEEWRLIAKEMEHKYEERLKGITPMKICKAWVQNMNKKGMCLIT